MKGIKDHEIFQEEIKRGISIVTKFRENFFISKIMEEQSKKGLIAADSSNSSSSQDRPAYDENNDES